MNGALMLLAAAVLMPVALRLLMNLTEWLDPTPTEDK